MLPPLGAVSGAVFHYPVLLGASESDAVIEDEVTLHLVREVTAAQKLDPRGRADPVGRFDQVHALGRGYTVPRLDRSGQHPFDGGT